MILASGSAARARLLTAAGFTVEVRRPDFEEGPLKRSMLGAAAPDVALALAEGKARSVSSPGALVLGGDQMLSLEGKWLTKPCDRFGLARQIGELQGRTHELHSAAVLMREGEVLWRGVETARLTMRSLTKAEIDAYVAGVSQSVLGCVGGYEIEGLGVTLFERIEGDLFTIQGLPLLSILKALRELA